MKLTLKQQQELSRVKNYGPIGVSSSDQAVYKVYQELLKKGALRVSRKTPSITWFAVA